MKVKMIKLANKKLRPKHVPRLKPRSNSVKEQPMTKETLIRRKKPMKSVENSNNRSKRSWNAKSMRDRSK